jgi:serine/threonine-protein phosphatase PP1 catalytic subunit
VVDDDKVVDEPDRRSFFSERLRRVRRKPGLDELGAQIDGTATYPPRRRKGHKRSRSWSNPSSAPSGDCAQSLLQSIQQLDIEHAQRRKRSLKEQQALWEATMPKPRSLFIEHRAPSPAPK